MIERIDVIEMFIVTYKMGIYKETENIYACQLASSASIDLYKGGWHSHTSASGQARWLGACLSRKYGFTYGLNEPITPNEPFFCSAVCSSRQILALRIEPLILSTPTYTHIHFCSCFYLLYCLLIWFELLETHPPLHVSVFRAWRYGVWPVKGC